ncbi:MAG: hypothetical protein AAFR73_13015 [Pseudomonadota bacterium]
MSALKLVKLAMLLALSALSCAASPVHHVRFAQPAMILVWQDEALIGQGDDIALTGISNRPQASLLGSGSLIGATDTLGRVQRIKIASNTRFEIHAAGRVAQDLVSVRLINVGENAKARISGSGFEPHILFRQSDKTAYRPGTPLSQALTLEIEWSGPAPPILHVTAL